MADEENDIEIVLEEPKKSDSDAPQVEIVDDSTAREAHRKEVEPDEGINELKKSLEREKRAREDAEARARVAYEQAQKANVDKADSEYHLIVNAIENFSEKSNSLKASYADAMAAGDYARAAEIQVDMTVNTAQLEKLKDGERAMKQKMQETEKAPVHQVAPPRGDLVDQIAATASPRSADWLRSSREHIRSERDVRKMLRAHDDAIDDGIEPDTDAYFQYIESRLGIKKQEAQAESPLSEASAPAQRRSVSPPPAPVSRGNAPRPNVMRLSRAEAETARDLGMTPEEYAKNKAALIKENRYGQ